MAARSSLTIDTVAAISDAMLNMSSPSAKDGSGYLTGQLLVATPLISGPSFNHAVIFICAHNNEGAMGIIINHIIESISYGELFQQLSLTADEKKRNLPVHFGGPVEINRGFVVFDNEGKPPHADATLTVGDISVSSSVSILREIAAGAGPKDSLLALGYAGWGPGQVESEIEQNSWISVPANKDLIFHTLNEHKWEKAAKHYGIDLTKLSTNVGHA